MICYNVTVKIIPGIEAEWIDWQQHEHIPEIMATGLFYEYRIFRLLDQDESEGISFVIQYFSSSRENYERYITGFAPMLRQKALSRWGNRFIAFRTVMEAVN